MLRAPRGKPSWEEAARAIEDLDPVNLEALRRELDQEEVAGVLRRTLDGAPEREPSRARPRLVPASLPRPALVVAAVAILAMLALTASITPPGRAAVDWIRAVVDVEDRNATRGGSRDAQQTPLGTDGERLATGEAPDGSTYEVSAEADGAGAPCLFIGRADPGPESQDGERGGVRGGGGLCNYAKWFDSTLAVPWVAEQAGGSGTVVMGLTSAAVADARIDRKSVV